MSYTLYQDFDVVYTSESNDINIATLKQTFKNVFTIYDPKEAIWFILSRRQHQTMIFLIDIDQHFSLLETIGQYNNVVPIACSAQDKSPVRILKCLELGAVNFIMKPFSQPVLKTLFLNIYRHKKSSVKDQSLLAKFQGRLKYSYTIMNNHFLTNTLVQQYTLQPVKELSSERRSFLKEFINNWEFSPFTLTEADLIYCAYTVFEQTFEQFIDLAHFQMKEDAMYSFIFDIYHSYHNANPYHNFKHALDVLQSTWYYLRSLGLFFKSIVDTKNPLKLLLKPVHILALLIASLGHDVGHPGVNNGFLISTSSPLSVLYNDTSVLENYHSAALFHILSRHYHHSNINLTSLPEYKEFRQVIVQSILCTDMSCHQEHINHTKTQIERLHNNTINTSTEVLRNKERITICNIIMKCADISNCARPFETAKEWAIALSHELFIQGDLEQELGLLSIPFNVRGQVSLSDFQIGFINNMALDLYTTVADLFPELSFCRDSIQENVILWKQIKF